MEQSKKNLKVMSILMLCLALVSLVLFTVDLIITDYNVAAIEGATKGVLIASVIITGIIGLLISLPQIYIGIKGIKVSKNPDSSKAHIVWATILFAIAVIGVFLYAYETFFGGDSVAVSSLELSNVVVDVFLYYFYIKYAKEVKAGA